MICMVSLVGQWLEEAKSKLDGSLKLYMYHGSSRKRDANYLAANFDLVITTYQVQLSPYPCRQPANLLPRLMTGQGPWRCMLKVKCTAAGMSFSSDPALHQVKAELELWDQRKMLTTAPGPCSSICRGSPTGSE